MAFIDCLYLALFSPRRAGLRVGSAEALVLLGLVALMIALPLSGALGMGGFGALGVFWVTAGVIAAQWFWLGTSLSLCARMLGGKGGVEGTLAAVVLASSPWVLTPIAASSGNLMRFSGTSPFLLVLGIWTLTLLASFVARAHGFGWPRAVASLALLAGIAGFSLVAATAALVLLVAVTAG